MRKSVCGAALVISLLPQLAGAAQPPLTHLQRADFAMGTQFTIELYGTNLGRMEAATESAFEELHRVDSLLSNYQPQSEWSRVNDQAADHPVAVSPELFDLLRACVSYSERSEGSFDISVGALMKVWGFYKGTGQLPHRAEVRAALASVGYRNMVFDARAHTIRFLVAGLNLDPGGVGKGYVVDKMADVLRAGGITSALVSGGGSSIYAIGAPPDNARGWYVRIRDPKDANKTAAEVYLKNNSLSTSGNYEKFFRAEGKLYSHIMDPRTGFPAEGMLSVSVVAPRTLDSEVWAKPYYILGRAWTERHKPADFSVFMCEDKASQACAWLP